MRTKTYSPSAIWSLIAVETQSVLGSEIARFGISVWVYKTTNSVTAFATLVIANTVPGIILAPLVGSLVDRYSRKRTIIAASILGLIGTLLVLSGAARGELSLSLVICGAALASIGETFQWTALASTLPLMSSAAALPRFNGFVEAGRALSMLAGPIVGGALYGVLGLPGLLTVEVATFVIAMLVLSVLTLPRPEMVPGTEAPSLWADSLFGLRWLWEHKLLLKLLSLAVFANFFISIGIVLMTPYGLSILSDGAFGIANGLFGGGMMCGGLLYGVLAPRFSNMQQIFTSLILVGCAFVGYGFARDLVLIGLVNFIFAMMITVNNAATLTIWQRQIPEQYAGRVLSAVRMVAYSTGPVAYLLAGPLAETVVPHLYASAEGTLSRILRLWGDERTGQMGFLFSAMGVCLVLGFLAAVGDASLRQLEKA